MTESPRVDRRPDGHDPGLQPERTLLAWSRTALILAVNAVLILRTGLAHRQPGLAAMGAALAAIAAGLHVHGLYRRRRLELPGRHPEAAPAPAVRGMAVLVVVVAAAAVWCAAISPPTSPPIPK